MVLPDKVEFERESIEEVSMSEFRRMQVDVKFLSDLLHSCWGLILVISVDLGG